MDKPAIFAGVMMCPFVWVMYQLVVTGNPAFLFHLLAFAAMVKVLDSNGVAKEGTDDDSVESHLPIGMTITDDGLKGGYPSDEVPEEQFEVAQHLDSGNELDKVDVQAAGSDATTDSGEYPLLIGTVIDHFDRLDLEDAHPFDQFPDEQPEVQMQLNTVPDEDCNTTSESDCPVKDSEPDEEGCKTTEFSANAAASDSSDSHAVPDKDYRLEKDAPDGPECLDEEVGDQMATAPEVHCRTSDSPADGDYAPVVTTFDDCRLPADALDGPQCLAEDDSAEGTSDVLTLRPLQVDWAVGGVLLRKEPPKLRVDIDVRKPRFIQTILVSAAEGDDPLPPPEFFYNYRFFYFRHRGNWREMRSKGVHRPTLATVEEEECRPKVVVIGTDDPVVMDERKAKGAKKRLGRRIRKAFREWKKSSSCLLPMFG